MRAESKPFGVKLSELAGCGSRRAVVVAATMGPLAREGAMRRAAGWVAARGGGAPWMGRLGLGGTGHPRLDQPKGHSDEDEPQGGAAARQGGSEGPRSVWLCEAKRATSGRY